MQNEQLEHYLDIRYSDVDLITFALALAIQHVTHLLAFGGTSSGRPDPESALLPDHLKAFVARAVAEAQRLGRFTDELRHLERLVPLITSAWELGYSLFQSDLAQASSDREHLEHFSRMDYATELARTTACRTYERDKTMRAWLIAGYLRAWLQHFFPF